MVEFYLLAFPRFSLRKKEHKSYKGKNRTHDFRTSRYAGYPLDHSGDERQCEVLSILHALALYLTANVSFGIKRFFILEDDELV